MGRYEGAAVIDTAGDGAVAEVFLPAPGPSCLRLVFRKLCDGAITCDGSNLS